MAETVIKSIPVQKMPNVDDMENTYGIGVSVFPFSESKTYEIGDKTYYNSKVWKFKNRHAAGPWLGTDATQTTETVATKKFDMTFLSEGMKDIEESAKKPDDFSPTETYLAGDVVTYSDGLFYEFTKDHTGAWTGTDAKEVKFMITLNKRELTKDYTVRISNVDAAFIKKDILVTATSKDGKKVIHRRTDSAGTCVLPLNIDKEWTVTAEDRFGYIRKPMSVGIGHSISRYSNAMDIIFGYEIYYGTCKMKVNVRYDDGSPAANSTVAAIFKDIGSSAIATTDASGHAEIDCPKNVSGTFYFERPATYTYPGDIDTVACDGKELDMVYSNEIYYMVGETETSKRDKTAWKEYLIQDFPFEKDGSYDATKHPAIAVHVATSELLGKEYDYNGKHYTADYYVRIADLTTARPPEVARGRQWCTVNQLHPHVTTSTGTDINAYKGNVMTDYMISDSIDMGATSPAAEFAKSQTLTINGVVHHGFIGTYRQMNPLFQHYQCIYRGLTKFGYGGNFRTGTHWWSACQYSATNAWYWHSGGYAGTRNLSKNFTSISVLSFFAVV